MARPSVTEYAPRLMRAEEAARYVAMSPSSFREQVRLRKLPQPVPMPSRNAVWDRHDLDEWVENRREANEWDE